MPLILPFGKENAMDLGPTIRVCRPVEALDGQWNAPASAHVK